MIALLFALLATAPAAADDEPPIAVLDFRPLHPRGRGRTDLDLVPEAARQTSRVREAIAQATGRRVLTTAELAAILGPYWRVRAFECQEDSRCLRPLLGKLARARVPLALVGTMETDRDKLGIELGRYDVAAGRIDKIVILEIRRNAPIDVDVVARIVGPLIGARPKPETTTTEPKPVEAKPTEPAPAPTPPAPDTGGDVVESVGPEAPAPAPPPLPDRTQLTGWLRSSLELGLKDQGFHQNAPDPTGVPWDPLVARQQMYVHLRYARGRSFEAVASALLDAGLFESPTASPTESFNGFNGAGTTSSFDTSARELYVGAFTGSFDLRVGLQRIAWGRGDIVTPNDVVNAHDIRDPFLGESEVLHIPTFAVRGDLDLGFGVLQLIVSPFFTPDKFDFYGYNWAAVQPSAPAPIRGFLNLASRLIDPSLLAELQPLLAQTQLPSYDGSDTSAGGRFSWTAHGLDVSHYYWYGFDGVPDLKFDPRFVQALSMIDFTMAKPSDLTPVLQLLDMGVHPFDARYVRRHHVGMDLVTTFDSFAFRLDGAYDSTRVFRRTDLEGFLSAASQVVASLEYQTGDVGKLVLMEAVWQHLFEPVEPGTLIGAEQDSYGVAVALRWTFAEHFETELRGYIGDKPYAYIVRPQIGLKWNAFAVRAGLILLGGDPNSLPEYFDRNQTFYVLAKYSL